MDGAGESLGQRDTWLNAGNSGADFVIEAPTEVFRYRSEFASDADYTAAMTAIRLNTLDGVHWPASYYRLWLPNIVTQLNNII